ncbi:MAG: glycerophosphodiester phosphodiesterase family protein [Armatimonadota bacterium]|nr:glycerophosphodiester phosphodiesterase family protein [Armatimonadota bacterium]
MREFMVIAHRGDSVHAPENTLAAFRRALALGVTDIETDVRAAADGTLLLLHDATVDRTTDGTGPLVSLTSGEVRALDAGSWFAARFAGERIPLLEEALDLCEGRARLHLELKESPPAALEQLLATLAARGHPRCGAPDAPPSIVLTSFDRAVLGAILARDARWCTAWLLPPAADADAFPAVVAAAAADGIRMLCPHALAVTPAQVDACHAAGIMVRCWGVGRQLDRIRRVLAAGADGATVDDPGAVQALLRTEG